MLTVKAVAEQIGVSTALIYEWCQAGMLPHYKFGKPGKRGKIMIDEMELQAFLAACKKEARPQSSTPPLKHIHLG